MFPSITFVISLVFLGYISFSIYELVKMYYPPQCSNNPRCVDYYLTHRPKLQLCIFTSSERFLDGFKDESHLKTLSDFNYSVPFEIDLEVNIPKKTKQNGTLFLHLFLLSNTYKIKLWKDAMGKIEHVYTSIPLTGYQIRSKEFELLKGEKVDHDEVPITHLKKHIGFNILTGVDSFFRDDVPLEFIPYIKFRANRILPIMHHDFLNDRLDNLEVLSSENNTANFKLTYSPVNIGKMRLMLQMELSLKSVKKYGFSDKDIDQMKSLFGDTNIYLLSVTLFVASVHLLFDFLSIKNDVYFWRGKKSMVGLSLRNILWRAFSQIIIFFYLLDEETSVLVVAPAGISALIEIWKVQKVLPIDWRRLKFKNVVLSAEEKRTRDLDGQGMKYLSYILYPLCIIGALYSLLYLQHKSWYSWMIHNLVNGVYAFGFLFMLPQLFINYKLKSVAHLPWRVFMYKAFNTVIDDLFAFIITMPTAHRLACFRDDIVFFIYLYQRWLYPVDKTRIEGPVKED